jgi:hypothetical protein
MSSFSGAQLRSLFHSMQVDSGKHRVYQSHKVTLSKNSLKLFRQMALDSDILDQFERSDYYHDLTINETLVEGVESFQEIISHKDHDLSRLRSHIPTYNLQAKDSEVSQLQDMINSDDDAMGSDEAMDEVINLEEFDPPSSDCM